MQSLLTALKYEIIRGDPLSNYTGTRGHRSLGN